MDVERTTNGWAALGALIRDARKRLGLSQSLVVQLLTEDLVERGHARVHQSVVSANEAGDRWRDRPELVGAYTRVLQLDESEVRATLYGLPQEQTTAPTFEDLVRNDPSLDEDSKRHIITQYGLLRAATLHNRAQRKTPSPDRSMVTDEEVAEIEHAFGRDQGDATPPPGGAAESA